MEIAARTGASVLRDQVLARAIGVQRVHHSVGTADEHPAADDGGLSKRAVHAREPEGPFQFQPWNLIGCQARRVCRLESVLRRIGAPPVPAGAIERIREGGSRARRAAVVDGCGARSQRRGSQQSGENVDLCRRQFRALRAHGAGGQRQSDGVWRQAAQSLAVRRARNT